MMQGPWDRGPLVQRTLLEAAKRLAEGEATYLAAAVRCLPYEREALLWAVEWVAPYLDLEERIIACLFAAWSYPEESAS